MAALESTAELNKLLDQWKKEDEEHRSVVHTLSRFVHHAFFITSLFLFNI